MKTLKTGLTLFCLCTASLYLNSNETLPQKEVMEIEQTPKHLYKVLSFKLWEATQSEDFVMLTTEDDAFIHFSKEDQVDRIITKYWSESPQFVVLKIDTNKLEGNLVYEANHGGSAKYYHLYNGFIPISSIVESTIIDNKR